MSAEKTKKEKPAFWSFENLRSLAILILAILALRWSVASPYHVPTASMEPTIKVGDRLPAWKLAYGIKIPFTDYSVVEWKKPQRGDIIVFRYPGDPDIDYVKRIVGVAGDELQLIEDVLHVNGEPQVRLEHNQDRSVLDDIEDNKDIKVLFREKLNDVVHWVMQNQPGERQFTSGFWPSPGMGPHKVAADSVFAIGDNRDNSRDSRMWGEVPMSYVRGKALFVIWSLWSPPGEWFRFRWSRFGEWLK